MALHCHLEAPPKRRNNDAFEWSRSPLLGGQLLWTCGSARRSVPTASRKDVSAFHYIHLRQYSSYSLPLSHRASRNKSDVFLHLLVSCHIRCRPAAWCGL